VDKLWESVDKCRRKNKSRKGTTLAAFVVANQ